MLDKVLGKPGDLAREQYETDINAFLIGETIKKARLQRKLTQAQLGELMGVKRAQVSRIALVVYAVSSHQSCLQHHVGLAE